MGGGGGFREDEKGGGKALGFRENDGEEGGDGGRITRWQDCGWLKII